MHSCMFANFASTACALGGLHWHTRGVYWCLLAFAGVCWCLLVFTGVVTMSYTVLILFHFAPFVRDIPDGREDERYVLGSFISIKRGICCPLHVRSCGPFYHALLWRWLLRMSALAVNHYTSLLLPRWRPTLSETRTNIRCLALHSVYTKLTDTLHNHHTLPFIFTHSSPKLATCNLIHAYKSETSVATGLYQSQS